MFLERPGTRKWASYFAISPRPNSDLVRQLNFSYRLEEFRRMEDGELETRTGHLAFRTFFEDGSVIVFAPHHFTEVHLQDFRLPGGLTVPPGRYSWWAYPVLYSLNPARKLSGQFRYGYTKDYYGKGGKRTSLLIGPVIKLSSRCEIKERDNG